MNGKRLLKMVGASGQLALGKKYSGRRFEIEELTRGELILRPVPFVHEAAAPAPVKSTRISAFRIATVELLLVPNRDQRNARHK